MRRTIKKMTRCGCGRPGCPPSACRTNSFSVYGDANGGLIAARQFLQRYMDVSQPLPDVPALEIHCHKDPTTAAVDKRKRRNPRYWRDMDEESVKKIQEAKYRKNIRLR